jgi:hypothetical protein
MLSNSSWSDELRAYTLASLKHWNDFLPMRDEIYMKHIKGQFGYITLEDYARQVARIYLRSDGAICEFASIDAMISAGWVMD